MKKLVICAFGVLAVLGLSGRTVSVDSVTGGKIIVAFGPAAADEVTLLTMAWGPEDAGTDLAQWPNSRLLGSVAPEETSRTIDLPQGWGTDSSWLRLFLQNGFSSPDAYVTDGLVTQWDGIDNAGTGVHDSAAKVWKDLAGSLDLTLTNKAAWVDGKALSVDAFSAVAASPAPTYKTIEILCRSTGGKAGGSVVFTSGIGSTADTQLNRLVVDISGTVQFKAGITTFVPFPRDCSFSSLVAIYTGDTPTSFYRNGSVAAETFNANEGWRRAELGKAALGGRVSWEAYAWQGSVCSIRLYDRVLTADEIAANYRRDAVRFLGMRNEATETSVSDLHAYAPAIRVDHLVKNALGAQVAAALSFSDIGAIGEIRMVWGASDAGADPAAWANMARVGFVRPGDARKTVALPTGWGGSSARVVRYYFVAGVDAPAGYVTSGLVTRWDGIDNAGAGTHDATATVWKDLAGALDMALTNNAVWNADANGLVVTGCSAIAASATTAYRTIEVVASQDVPQRNSILFYSGQGNSHFRSVFVDTYPLAYLDGSTTTLAAPIVCDGTPRSLVGTYGTDNHPNSLRMEGELVGAGLNNGWSWGPDRRARIGHRTNDASTYAWRGVLHTIRLYSSVLTEAQILSNAALDLKRFNGAGPVGAVQAISDACLYVAATPPEVPAVTLAATGDSAPITVDLRTGVRTLSRPSEVLPFTWSSTNFAASQLEGTYVTDGLVTRWDALDNEGTGAHNPKATIWKDLAGGLDLALTARGSWNAEGNGLVVNGYSAVASTYTPTYRTIECVYKMTNCQDRTILFSSGNPEGKNSSNFARFVLIDSTATGATSMKVYLDGTKTTKHTPMAFDSEALRTVAGNYNDNHEVSHIYGDGIESSSTMKNTWWGPTQNATVGQRQKTSDKYDAHGILHAIRLYDRELSESELARNHVIDVLRFSGTPLLSIEPQKLEARVRLVRVTGEGDDLATWTTEVADSSRTLVRAKGESTVQWHATPGVWRVNLEFLVGETVVYTQTSVFDLRAMPPDGTVLTFR